MARDRPKRVFWLAVAYSILLLIYLSGESSFLNEFHLSSPLVKGLSLISPWVLFWKVWHPFNKRRKNVYRRIDEFLIKGSETK